MVTGDRHQDKELCLAVVVGFVGNGLGHVTNLIVERTTCDVIQHVLSVCLIHINGSYIVVLTDGTQILLELQVAHVTTIVIIALGVTMAHESHNTLIYSGLDVSLVVQSISQYLGIAFLSHQRGTYHHVQVETLHIGFGEVAIAVVHEVLYITVAHTAIFLTRNHLQRLYHNLLIACQSDSREPVLRIVIVLRVHILTCTGIVDTNSRREREIHIPAREVGLVVIDHLIEGVVGLFPSRTKGYKQDHLVTLLL